MKKLLLILFVLFIPSICNAQVTDMQGIKTILGEAENQSLEGMTALGEALRTRGRLKGVYGYKAIVFKDNNFYRKTKKGLRLIDKKTEKKARLAWQNSLSSNLTKGANGWGNKDDIKIFIKEGWWSDDLITTEIGSHTFYKG